MREWSEQPKEIDAITLFVDDLEAVLPERLRPANGPMNRPWGIRTAAFADPSGHVWEIAQELS